MISKLLSVLSTAKGAAVAVVIVAAGVTAGVAATNPDVRSAIADVTHVGQPAVVAARNDADKNLREAFQDDQRKLEKLRSSKVDGPDRRKLEDIVNAADQKLRARLTTALDDVAALTLGREGLESPKPSGSPSAKPSGSPDVKVSFSPAAAAQVDAIVSAAIADMDKIVKDAEAAVAALPTFEPGKPSERPTARPTPTR